MTSTKKIIKCYSELYQLKTFEERFEYLKIGSSVGKSTFGFNRWINQAFYRTDDEYKKARRAVIIRDLSCDLGVIGHEIMDHIIIHHMNPITEYDIVNRTEYALNPEFMICVSDLTHKAIHYSNIDLLPKSLEERRPNDTCPWRLNQNG